MFIRAALWGLAVLLLASFCAPLTHAHRPGRPAFLKINDGYVDYYQVLKARPQHFELPESTDIRSRAPGQQLKFEIDLRLLKVSYANVDAASFRWEFGDGRTATGLRAEHQYSRAGTYIVRAFARFPGLKERPIESAAVYVFPAADYQLARPYIQLDGRRHLNNTERLPLEPEREYRFSVEPQPAGAEVIRYVWDFGDGGRAEGQSVTHRYAAGVKRAYPVVRAYLPAGLYTDNSVWLEQVDQPATTASLYEQVRQLLEKALAAVFAPSGTNWWLAMLILLFAVVAGGLHSLTPGHGKTVLAALLIGSDSRRYKDLLTLTIAITVAHTAVIYLIGFVFLWLSSAQSANQLVPYFEAVSFGLVFALAVYLIITGWRRLKRPSRHHHPVVATSQRRTTWSLILAGTGGGIIPCIDALSLMLLAIGLGRVEFGLLLVLCFSLGLAATIALIGLALIAGKRRLLANERRAERAARYAPLVSGLVILLLALLSLI